MEMLVQTDKAWTNHMYEEITKWGSQHLQKVDYLTENISHVHY